MASFDPILCSRKSAILDGAALRLRLKISYSLVLNHDPTLLDGPAWNIGKYFFMLPTPTFGPLPLFPFDEITPVHYLPFMILINPQIIKTTKTTLNLGHGINASMFSRILCSVTANI
jgi:hypothetical protein